MPCQQRCVHYTDGSPSREVEDEDWEATGQEEMNELYDRCKKQNDESCGKLGLAVSIVGIRDEINNVRDLIDVCGTALLADKTGLEERTRKHVAHVLYFYVDSILADLEKELQKL